MQTLFFADLITFSSAMWFCQEKIQSESTAASVRDISLLLQITGQQTSGQFFRTLCFLLMTKVCESFLNEKLNILKFSKHVWALNCSLPIIYSLPNLLETRDKSPEIKRNINSSYFCKFYPCMVRSSEANTLELRCLRLCCLLEKCINQV